MNAEVKRRDKIFDETTLRWTIISGVHLERFQHANDSEIGRDCSKIEEEFEKCYKECFDYAEERGGFTLVTIKEDEVTDSEIDQ